MAESLDSIHAVLESQFSGSVWCLAGERLPGRNQNYLFENDLGEKVFVKQLCEAVGEGRRFENLAVAHQHRQSEPALHRSIPKIIGADQESQIIVYEFIGGVSLAEQLALYDVAAVDWRGVGSLLARVHSIDSQGVPEPESLANQLRIYVRYMEAVDFDTFWHFSGAEIELWSLLQSRREPILAQSALIGDPSYPSQATHGDVRLDQFLLDAGSIVLVDWERYARGDPARDLGMLTGDVFAALFYEHISESTMLSTGAQQHADTDPRIREAGARAREFISEIWAGYLSTTTIAKKDLQEFQLRAGWNLAWHCIERVSSRAQFQMKLTGLDKALLGIALAGALKPADTALAFGMDA